MTDFDCTDVALHPDPAKQDEIWMNIGTPTAIVQLTLPTGHTDVDGDLTYAAFEMNTNKEIDDVIAMLNESKVLMVAYRKEFAYELGLLEDKSEDNG